MLRPTPDMIRSLEDKLEDVDRRLLALESLERRWSTKESDERRALRAEMLRLSTRLAQLRS